MCPIRGKYKFTVYTLLRSPVSGTTDTLRRTIFSFSRAGTMVTLVENEMQTQRPEHEAKSYGVSSFSGHKAISDRVSGISDFGARECHLVLSVFRIALTHYKPGGGATCKHQYLACGGI
jgi:hypothetical protein